MSKVIEFIILIFCIAAACGIISWLVWSGNKMKQNQKNKNNENDNSNN